MKLNINTSSLDRVSVSLEGDGKILTRSRVPDRKTQDVLPFIESLLKESGKSLHDISAVSVDLGPGSFTGLRVGAAIANTLGALLHIPINDLPVGELVKPQYS